MKDFLNFCKLIIVTLLKLLNFQLTFSMCPPEKCSVNDYTSPNIVLRLCINTLFRCILIIHYKKFLSIDFILLRIFGFNISITSERYRIYIWIGKIKGMVTNHSLLTIGFLTNQVEIHINGKLLYGKYYRKVPSVM